MSSPHELFGNPASYEFLARKAAWFGNRVLPSPSDRPWTEEEYSNFCLFLELNWVKIKTWFVQGRILILENSIDGMHAVGVLEISRLFHRYEDTYNAANSLDEYNRVFNYYGRCHCTVIDGSIQPDASFGPKGGDAPSFLLEVADTQPAASVYARVTRLLNYSLSARYIMSIKIYACHIPARVAMVMSLWRKPNDASEHNLITGVNNWEAVRFVSFGNRALTNAELQEHPELDDAAPNLAHVDHDKLEGVTGGDNHRACTAPNHEDFNLFLDIHTLFSTPNNPDPVPGTFPSAEFRIDLYVVKTQIINNLVTAFINGARPLNNQQMLDIIAHVPHAEFPKLRNYALQHAVLPE